MFDEKWYYFIIKKNYTNIYMIIDDRDVNFFDLWRLCTDILHQKNTLGLYNYCIAIAIFFIMIN